MIYANVQLKALKREFDFGEIFGVSLGQRGTGRREIFIPSPENLKVCRGPNIGLTLAKTKSGRLRINKVPAQKLPMYMFLETCKGNLRKGNGDIRTNIPSAVEVLATGISAEGKTGQLGQAPSRILLVKSDNILRVRYSGDFNVDFFVCNITAGKICRVPYYDVPSAVESGIKFPLDWSIQSGPALDVNWKKI